MIRRPPSSTLFPATTLFRSFRSTAPPGAARASPPPSRSAARRVDADQSILRQRLPVNHPPPSASHTGSDRKSTRLNSSHANISYAVFCLKKKTLAYKAQDLH